MLNYAIFKNLNAVKKFCTSIFLINEMWDYCNCHWKAEFGTLVALTMKYFGVTHNMTNIAICFHV